jgi:hypothetical protein
MVIVFFISWLLSFAFIMNLCGESELLWIHTKILFPKDVERMLFIVNCPTEWMTDFVLYYVMWNRYFDTGGDKSCFESVEGRDLQDSETEGGSCPGLLPASGEVLRPTLYNSSSMHGWCGLLSTRCPYLLPQDDTACRTLILRKRVSNLFVEFRRRREYIMSH